MRGVPNAGERALNLIGDLAQREVLIDGRHTRRDAMARPVAIGDGARRVTLERGDLTRDFVGVERIVRIEPLNVIAARGVHSHNCARGSHPAPRSA